ncbi:uncharacterized protein LOC142466467 isoform X2 [Ascaphus truei]|uniref:uncharacterized protein LOC142466467 isoform X2 n=1 Tax=Ascaphus truei TaxID=8439 RepID=UPI003F5A2A91
MESHIYDKRNYPQKCQESVGYNPTFDQRTPAHRPAGYRLTDVSRTGTYAADRFQTNIAENTQGSSTEADQEFLAAALEAERVANDDYKLLYNDLDCRVGKPVTDEQTKAGTENGVRAVKRSIKQHSPEPSIMTNQKRASKMHRPQSVRSPRVAAEMQTQNKKPRAPQPEKPASKTTVRQATRRVPDKCNPAHDNEQPSTSKALYGLKRPTTTVTVTIEPPPATMLNSPTATADIISRATGGESARINTTPVSGRQQAQLENILRRIDFGRRPRVNDPDVAQPTIKRRRVPLQDITPVTNSKSQGSPLQDITPVTNSKSQGFPLQDITPVTNSKSQGFPLQDITTVTNNDHGAQKGQSVNCTTINDIDTPHYWRWFYNHFVFWIDLNRLIENVISDLKTLIFVKEHERDLERLKALLLRLRRSSDIFHKGVMQLKGDLSANNQNIKHDVIITTPCTDNTHPKATTTLCIEDESDIESRGCTEYLFWVDVKRSINAFMRGLYSHCWVPQVERNMCMEPAFKLKLDRLTTVFSNGAQLLTNS